MLRKDFSVKTVAYSTGFALVLIVCGLAWYVGGPSGSPSAASKISLAQAPAFPASDASPAASGEWQESFPFEESNREYARAHAPGAPSQDRTDDEAESADSGTLQVNLPLVFVEPDAKAALSESQIAVLKSLREQFVAAVGGAGQDPSDPAYLARWQTAQAEFDARLKAWMGSSVYNSLERTAFTENIRLTTQAN